MLANEVNEEALFQKWDTTSVNLVGSKRGEVIDQYDFRVALSKILTKDEFKAANGGELTVNADAMGKSETIRDRLEKIIISQNPGFTPNKEELQKQAIKFAKGLKVKSVEKGEEEIEYPLGTVITITQGTTDPEKPVEPKPGEEKKVETKKIIAFDIHDNDFVYEKLHELKMRDGWRSEKDYADAFYINSYTLKRDYLYVGYATKDIAPVLIYRGTYLEKIATEKYQKLLAEYGADIVAFVVPREIEVKTYHIFPKGTRDDLIEIINVPYETWASLQTSWNFMDLPAIFQTRIQKVNEMGFAFNHVEYYNGVEPITGLVSSFDWAKFPLRGDHDNKFCARVFYDKAVAAAKEVPTEKKVDAATAPQAQIQAPAAQAPVTAANTTTTTAPVNTLPVTGASDSIFLFLSSAALMAVGILFFKKH